MAYFDSYDPNDDPKNLKGTAPGQPQSTIATSAPAVVPSSSGVTSSAPASATPQQPTAQNPGPYVSFTQRYMANKDAADATAKRLQTDVTNRGQTAQTGIDSAFKTFQTKAIAGTPTTPGPQAPKYAPPTLTSARFPQGTPTLAPQTATPGSLTNTYKPSPTQDQMPDADLKTIAGQSYTGPNDLQSAIGADPYSKLVGDVQDANTRAGLVGSAEGRQALLKDNTGSGTAFDEALASAGGTDWAGLKAKFGGLSDQLAKNTTAAKTEADVTRADLAQKAANASGVLQDRKTIADNPPPEPLQDDTRGKPIDRQDHGADGTPKSGVYFSDIPDGSIGNGNFRDYTIGASGIFYNGVFDGGAGVKNSEAVWNSMTPDEVNVWNSMPPSLRTQFIIQRAHQLGIKTKMDP